MTTGPHMDCQEVRSLLPLFFDGELDGRQMRLVALHSTRCPGCEDELHHLERLQEMIVERVRSAVDEVDLSLIWEGVARRVGASRGPRLTWLRDWWEMLGAMGGLRRPLYAALVGAAAVALVFWRLHGEPVAQQMIADNSVILDSVESHVDMLALLSEPETNTLVLWVSDEGVDGVNGSGGAR